jgi:hypothetical protein
MKIYFKEPRPATSGYNPILINYRLSKKLGKKPKLVIDYFDNILSKSERSKNTFDKLLELSKIRNPSKRKRKSPEKSMETGEYISLKMDFLVKLKT